MGNTGNNWMQIIQKYAKPDPVKSWVQLANSVIPYLALWVLMVNLLKRGFPYGLIIIISFIAALFLVRIFIIFHDCGHGSFFRSPALNLWTGIITGLFSFTPYHKWHYSHQIHHQTVGNLDKKGIGDVMTMTVDEYLNAPRWKKYQYRLYRNPLILFIIAPFFAFVVGLRFPAKFQGRKNNLYTHLTNLALIIIIIGLLSLWIGFKTFVLIQVPVMFFASVFGVWLFYVQHQFDGVVWVRSNEWNYKEIALKGSSYLKLPRILQWFSGNIGFHHIHHLGPKIPNYNLEKCYNENPAFQKEPLTFREALKTVNLALWDEKNKKLIRFSELHQTD